MRTIYLECAMGAAGDMLMSALSELLDPAVRQEFFETMNHLGLPGVQVTRRDAESCGIRGTRVEVTVHGQEEHSEDVDLHKIAAATGLVDDEEGLPQFFREHGRHLPREQVVDGSGCGMTDDGHGAFRPGGFRSSA